MKPRYPYCIFDLDGTLADSRQCAVRATRRAFAAHQLAIPDVGTIVRSMGIPIELSFPAFLGPTASTISLPALLETFRTFYAEEATSSLQLFPDIQHILTSFVTSSVRIGVATSKKTSVAWANCQALAIGEYIEALIGSDHVSHFKPHPEAIFRLLTHWNVDALSSVIMIGDSTFDIEMGKSAGIPTCAVLWGAHSKEALQQALPDYLATQPMDLLPIVLGADQKQSEVSQ